VPTDEAAAERLARGDRALVKLRQRDIDDPALLAAGWWDVLDAWREALEVGGPSAAVPGLLFEPDDDAARLWPDPDGSAARRVDGLVSAVLGRLAALSAAERDRWHARFADLAAEARRDAGHDERALARLERRFPATPAALAAALALADAAFVRGATNAAATWVERAEGHVALIDAAELAPGTLEALERRRTTFAPARGALARTAAWRRATGVREEARVPLPLSRGPAVDGYIGVRPGLAGLQDGSVCVQGTRQLFWFDADRLPRAGDPRRAVRSIEIDKLTGDRAEDVAIPYAAPGPPGWPLVPLAVGARDVVLVHGRLSHEGSNVVARVRLPGDEERGESPVARLVWAVSATWHVGPDGVETARSLLDSPELEFHAAPDVAGDVVCVQVRERPAPSRYARTQTPLAENRAYVVALDRATGELRWRRFLAKGTELVRGAGRAQRSLGPWAAQRTVTDGRRVFLGTHLGVGSLVDAADGRLGWSLLSRRRDGDAEGWIGGDPVLDRDAIVWAPSDSDRLYWLDPNARFGERTILGVRALGDGLTLVDGDRKRAAVMARAGARPALSSWERATGRRTDALYLEPLERVSGSLASTTRTFVSTDRGLYLFDRERDDLLLSVYPYEPHSGGGAVFGHEGRVYVVGHDLVRVVATD